MDKTKLPDEFPKTVADAVEWLESVLPDNDLARIAAMAQDELVNLHFGLGMYVRNSLQVWYNDPLKKDAGVDHDDDVSSVIIGALWRKLRQEHAIAENGQQVKQRRSALVGLVSDTHALTWPSVLAALKDVDLIIHAGDVGKSSVIERLEGIAPVIAVRDTDFPDDSEMDLPESRTLDIGGVRIHVIHRLKKLAIDPVADGIRVVVHGHTHRASVREENNVLYVNPGNAYVGDMSVGLLRIENGLVDVEIVEL